MISSVNYRDIRLSWLRWRVSRHLRNELGFFEAILKMDEDEAKAFLEWYLNHPYHKGIQEVLEIVKQGAVRNAKRSCNRTPPELSDFK
jgi:DNA-binding GntR family transcriptional regulator